MEGRRGAIVPAGLSSFKVMGLASRSARLLPGGMASMHRSPMAQRSKGILLPEADPPDHALPRADAAALLDLLLVA
jgi:hypothetical protein